MLQGTLNERYHMIPVYVHELRKVNRGGLLSSSLINRPLNLCVGLRGFIYASIHWHMVFLSGADRSLG